MKLILISDLHLGVSGELFWLDEIKFQNLQNVLEKYRHDADYFIFTGDTTESRHPAGDLICRFCKCLQDFGQDMLSRVFILSGNHDSYRRMMTPFSAWAFGTNSVALGVREVIGDQFLVLESRNWTELDIQVKLRGWAGDRVVRAESEQILISHIQVRDWTRGNGGASLEEIAGWGFGYVFLGDYHHDALWNGASTIVSIGTAGASSFRDLEIKSGYMVIDVNGNVVNHRKHYFSNHPIFRIFNVTENREPLVEPDEVENNIVRVRLNGADPFLTKQNRRKYWELFSRMNPRVLQIEFGARVRAGGRTVVKQGFETSDWPAEAQKYFHKKLQEKGYNSVGSIMEK